jgi:hypothetical protein
VRAHLLGDLVGQAGARVVHRQQDRGDVQQRVEVRAHELDVLEQLAEPLERVVLALDRDEQLLGRHHGVDREQPERGRAVDEHVVDVGAGPEQYVAMARCSRDSRATTLTSSISAPARSIVAGTQRRRGTPSAGCTTSAIGTPSMSTS